ncbi:phage/plasmid primase, P4 family [Actinoplanes sp. N902-109]|uniref:phage/plasmid primase, P4 family n=1 Tax=Actinoplanes sp. (strain N902-109) TaxID=649831 RepID=UPI0003295F2E|nr:phage/plasmid primase, P4 family [Actinoplanes sp. N902-109]AGL13857.1 hypothetical protein L083_0347 [Actinoplanes sp. N902-109]
MTDVRTAALAWHDAGYAVLPVKADGSKAPDVTTWKASQHERPARDQVQTWFSGHRAGLGLVCGAISGGLEMLELEGRAVAEGALDQLQQVILETGLQDLWMRVARGYAERSPSGGLHFLYRVDGAPVPGNTKLANRPAAEHELTGNEREVLAKHPHRVFPRGLAETRGEGGFVVIAPSAGATHPSGKPWKVVHGTPSTVAVITPAEREQLLTLFRSLDRMPIRETASPARPLQAVDNGGTKPGDDFESKAGWDDEVLLAGAGWKCLYTQGTTSYWRRPGKDTPGFSATTGRDPARDRLYVFSSATEFDTEVPYTKFGAYALLHHGGDYREAARELRRKGFGSPPPAAPGVTPGPIKSPPNSHPPVDGTAARQLEQPARETTGGELPAPAQPLAVARILVKRMTTPRAWWRGDFYQWAGTHYDVVEPEVIDHWLYQQTEHATYIKASARGGEEIVDWAPSKRKITDLAHALGIGALQRFGEAEACIATTNGVLTDVTDRVLAPHDPERFNLFSLPFAYDPRAECPQWLAFLDSVLPGDHQAHEFLGEWFGYVMSGRTDQQKMAALIGQRRSGKGTIARVLTAMLGQHNVAGLDLNLLGGTFGLENLIGKTLAVSGDVRWHSRSVGDAVPILLGVIGEDAVSVHRKNRTAWNGRLGTRFMLMSNDTPTFSDRSGALGGRMIYIKFDQSFFGREDTSLTDKLLGELPGILNWALDGLDRLNGRGRFTEPESGQAEADAVRRLSDPIGAFIEDWCHLGDDRTVDLDLLYLRYKAWCESEGRTKDSTTKEIFSRDLRAKVPGLVAKRERVQGKQTRILYGIGCDVTFGTGNAF